MIPVLPTQEIGSLRKPDYLINAWRAYFNKKISAGELNEHIKKASIESIRFLEEVGLDIVWDGEMHRWEMYHYPASNIKGFEFVGEVRVFDNRYFLKASVKGRPTYIKNYHLDELRFVLSQARKPVKIPITGPYTLADWSFNEYYISKWASIEKDPQLIRYNAKRELTLDLAKNVINPMLKELSKENVFRIQIDEPAATTHPREMDIFVESFNASIDGVEKRVSLHICYSNYDVLLPYVGDIKAVQLTLEFANRDSWERGVDDETRVGYAFLKKLSEYSYDKELGLGVVDVHTDRVEPVELIVDRITYALKFIPIEKLYVNPDCGLRTRRREVAEAKLRNLVEAVKRVRAEYGIKD